MTAQDSSISGRAQSKEWVPASRKRRLLAIYLDFVLFSVPWAWLHYEVRAVFPAFDELELYFRLLVFAVLELVLHRVWLWSPGNYLLSIEVRYASGLSSQTGEGAEQKAAFVDKGIRDRESWFTILLAVLFLLEGSKSLVRWTMWTPPIPFFGIQTGEVSSALTLILSGLTLCYVAYCVFKLERRALYVGISYFAVAIISVVMSWDHWDSWVGEMVIRRRGYQGLPIRAGEVEFMQSIFPEGLVLALVAYLLALTAVRKRLLENRD